MEEDGITKSNGGVPNSRAAQTICVQSGTMVSTSACLGVSFQETATQGLCHTVSELGAGIIVLLVGKIMHILIANYQINFL